jgi:hypothetical protein
MNRINTMGKTKITIWISPFKRTEETANRFIDLCSKYYIDYDVKFFPELQEYTTNKKPMSDKQKNVGLIIHDSLDIFLNKVIQFNDMLKIELKEQTKDNVLVIFGHSVFFSSLLSYHVTHEKHMPNNISSIQLPNCSISCESFFSETNKWKTFIVGSIAHLPENVITGNHVPFGSIDKN